MRFTIVLILCLSQYLVFGQESKVAAKQINWMSWQEAVEASKENPKKVYIDMYTDWCGWCKKMDQTTFQDQEVVDYMNEHFYAIKFDAEQKDTIIFNDHTFVYSGEGRRGAHQLASALLNGRLGYPSFVALDEDWARILISPGYKKPEGVLQELIFAKEEMYKTISWENYKQ